MSLVVTITKVSVTEPQSGMYIVTLNLICIDGADEVINQNFMQIKKDHIAVSIIQERFRMRMQEFIDRYKREQQLLGSVQLNNAVSALQTSLIG